MNNQSAIVSASEILVMYDGIRKFKACDVATQKEFIQLAIRQYQRHDWETAQRLAILAQRPIPSPEDQNALVILATTFINDNTPLEVPRLPNPVVLYKGQEKTVVKYVEVPMKSHVETVFGYICAILAALLLLTLMGCICAAGLYVNGRLTYNVKPPVVTPNLFNITEARLNITNLDTRAESIASRGQVALYGWRTFKVDMDKLALQIYIQNLTAEGLHTTSEGLPDCSKNCIGWRDCDHALRTLGDMQTKMKALEATNDALSLAYKQEEAAQEERYKALADITALRATVEREEKRRDVICADKTSGTRCPAPTNFGYSSPPPVEVEQERKLEADTTTYGTFLLSKFRLGICDVSCQWYELFVSHFSLSDIVADWKVALAHGGNLMAAVALLKVGLKSRFQRFAVAFFGTFGAGVIAFIPTILHFYNPVTSAFLSELPQSEVVAFLVDKVMSLIGPTHP